MESNMARRRRNPIPTPLPVKPGFVDNFDTGTLNTANWRVSTWNAPRGGKFQADRVSCAGGLLSIQLTQSGSPILSIGGEITFTRLLSYGTYEWIARASSTAATPDQVDAKAVSGSVTGLFNYVGASDTELDIEVEGCRPNLFQATTWHGEATNESTQVPQTAPLHAAFHSYKYVWKLGVVEYYFNNVLVAVHRLSVPTAPAYPMINHWGTNDSNWGGLATPGVPRWLWVKRFSFTPL
jgi:beta-glucanase (GH16 family)